MWNLSVFLILFPSSTLQRVQWNFLFLVFNKITCCYVMFIEILSLVNFSLELSFRLHFMKFFNTLVQNLAARFFYGSPMSKICNNFIALKQLFLFHTHTHTPTQSPLQSIPSSALFVYAYGKVHKQLLCSVLNTFMQMRCFLK